MIELIKPKNKIIFDCCCGKGRNSIALCQNGAKLVIAMDISKEMLEIAKERAKEAGVQDRIIFEDGDAEKLKSNDDYFDAVICIQALMHLPNPQKCVNELARVVKLGGIVIADHINKKHLWRISIRGWRNFFVFAILHRIYFSGIGLPFRHFLHKMFGYRFPLYSTIKRASKGEFLALFDQSKLTIVKVLEYGPKICPIYSLVCAKKNEVKDMKK